MTTIAFLGAGNIAQAIFGGLIQNGMDPMQIVAADPYENSRTVAEKLGVNTTTDNNAAIKNAGIVMICVKPNVVAEVLQAITVPIDGKLFISVAAGVTSTSIQSSLTGSASVVRCMPNTPALVREGMTALYAPKGVSADKRDTAEKILSAVGSTLWVEKEEQLDAVTAVSGSGPAYFFLLMESMINAAIAEGLSDQAARKLVLQTALGSARIILDQNADPADLRRKVTSPGGTTQAAVETLLAEGFEQMVAKAIHAARQRSIEMSKPSSA